MNAGSSFQDSDNLEDNLVGVETYEALSPTKKDFLPWHQPRKQFVRDEQWCAQIVRLLDDGMQHTFSARPLKYCGLPGTDLIDLRCFHDSVCAPRSLKLQFLGFNSAVATNSPEQIELNISRDEIAKLEFIDPISEVIPDDIRAVANQESIAWNKLEQFGPFDVVNLDLCDSFGADDAGLFTDNYYNAVSQLMGIQARQATPWLLFLTTRVGSNHVHADTLAKFKDRYSHNLQDCADFQVSSTDAFSIGDEAALAEKISTASGLHAVFLTGICKWLLGLAIGHRSSIEVKSVLGYRIVKEAPTTDIVSLAIKVIPHLSPAPDPLNLANVAPIKIDECALATRALKRVAKHVDVDQIIGNNEQIRNVNIDRMSVLLDAARYDISAYKAWVSSTLQ